MRDNLATLSVPAAEDPNRVVVTAGPDALAEGIAAIIDNPHVNLNYDGASGPVDFDATGNVSSRGPVAHPGPDVRGAGRLRLRQLQCLPAGAARSGPGAPLAPATFRS